MMMQSKLWAASAALEAALVPRSKQHRNSSAGASRMLRLMRAQRAGQRLAVQHQVALKRARALAAQSL